MAKEKRSQPQPKARQEAGVVEKDWEEKPRDEAIANGEHIDFEVQDAVDGVIAHRPSEQANSYMSQEEQTLEMQPQVMGPPPFGSPDAVTSAGRLLPLESHPLQAGNLPEDHPSAISEDYGQDVVGYTHSPSQTSHSITPPPTDLEMDQAGRRTAREGNYEEMTKPELYDEANRRGLEVTTGTNKADLVEALEESDKENDQS